MIIEIVYPPIVKAVNLIKSRAFLPPISQWEKGKKKKKKLMEVFTVDDRYIILDFGVMMVDRVNTEGWIKWHDYNFRILWAKEYWDEGCLLESVHCHLKRLFFKGLVHKQEIWKKKLLDYLDGSLRGT